MLTDIMSSQKAKTKQDKVSFGIMKAYVIAIVINTFLLLTLAILTSIGKYISLVFLIFSISPIALFTMVYLILKDDGFKGRELKENEEWGYQDKKF